MAAEICYNGKHKNIRSMDMKTSALFKHKTVLSFELFPPKPTSDETVIYRTLDRLAGLHPNFISVTYDAGGGANCDKTVQIASDVKKVIPHSFPPMEKRRISVMMCSSLLRSI